MEDKLIYKQGLKMKKCKGRSKVVFMVLIVGIIGSALVFGACSKHRSWGHHSPEKKAEYMMEHLTDELNLNASQQEVLKGMKAEMLGMHSSHQADRSTLHKRIIEQIKSEKIDQQVVLSLMDEKHKQMETTIKTLVQRFADFHKVLTPEQRNKLAKLVEDHSEHRGGHFY